MTREEEVARQYSGIIQFADGRPAANVRVRLMDKDGEAQEDVTVEEGLSDNAGRFMVTYAPGRQLNFSDIFLPYLRFDYALNAGARVHHAFIQPFQTVYNLPEISPTRFVPAVHGFQFSNSFPGFWIPFSIPAIPDIPPIKPADHYGLCGGLVCAAYDFLLAGREIPQQRRRPGRARPLHQYIHRRQVDSLGRFGRQVVRFFRWMTLSDDAVQIRTGNELSRLRQKLDSGNPAPLGLVYIGVQDSLAIWKNHQVLACGYTVEETGRITIQLYDPNYPRRNDVTLVCTSTGRSGLQCVQKIGSERRKPVRGFFLMPYTPVTPPAGLTTSA